MCAAVIVGCSVAGLAGLMMAAGCWYRSARSACFTNYNYNLCNFSLSTPPSSFKMNRDSLVDVTTVCTQRRTCIVDILSAVYLQRSATLIYGRLGQTIYIFILFLSSFFFSSPNLSGRRLDVYHTSTHGVALVRI